MSVRHRSMGALAPYANVIGTHRFSNCAHTSWTPLFSASPCYVGVVKTMDDVITPGFRKRMAKGEVFFNPLSLTRRESLVESTGSFIYHDPGISCVGTGTHYEINAAGPFSIFHLMNGNYTSPIPYRSIILQDDITSLVTEITTKGLAERGKADSNLFESVAEYKQTLELFTKPTKNIWRFLGKHEAKIKDLKRLGMRPDEAWLIYRYGIKPFISDVHSIIEGLKQKTGRRRQTTRAKGEISRNENSTMSIPTGPGANTFFAYQTSDYVKVRYTSIDEYVATTASNIGFTAKGLLTVPWELTPYSFVADWFVNIGDYLNAIAPAPEYKQLGSCIVVERSRVTRYQNTAIVSPPYVVDSIDGAVCYGAYYTKDRSSVGTPGVVLKNDFKLATIVRASDALALISQKLFQLFGKP